MLPCPAVFAWRFAWYTTTNGNHSFVCLDLPLSNCLQSLNRLFSLFISGETSICLRSRDFGKRMSRCHWQIMMTDYRCPVWVICVIVGSLVLLVTVYWLQTRKPLSHRIHIRVCETSIMMMSNISLSKEVQFSAEHGTGVSQLLSVSKLGWAFFKCPIRKVQKPIS